MKRYVILHNIRSAHNVGSVFRSTDGAGVSKIYLTGYTPTPTDRFGREDEKILKTSLGATKSVPYEVCENVQKLIGDLKEKGVEIVSVEQTKNSIDYKTYTPTNDVAFLFGNEIDGVDVELTEMSDVTVEIPMSGKKESLNVSVCAGVILFHYRD